MRGKDIAKTVIIIFLLLWAVYALWPTYRFWSLSPEEKNTLETEGKLYDLNKKAISMGLDLQGGMYLVLEVDLPALVEQLAENKDEQFDEILQQCREELNISTENFLTILRQNFEDRNLPLNRYWGDRNDSERQVINYLEDEAEGAMARSLQKLRNRVDRFGVSEPNISPLGSRRILIALPGVSNPDQAKELIQSTALLEFKMLKDPAVYSEVIEKIDKEVAQKRDVTSQDVSGTEDVVPTEEDTTREERAQTESQDKIVSVSELFGDQDVSTETPAEGDSTLLVDEQTFEENPFISLLRTMRQRGTDVSVPIENVNAVNRIIELEEVLALIPRDTEFLWGSEPFQVADKSYQQLFLVKKEAELTGQYLTNARVTIGSDVQSAGQPEVHFTLNRQGARIFSRVTAANIDKPMAIVLDNKVVSAPTIQSKIPDGRSRITGIPDMDEAKMISIVLEVGALPAPVEIIQESTIGPSLGQDSIRRGGYSTLIGMTIIIIFMIVYYRMAGMIADVALLMNLLILMAVLAQFRFTLTLPGVAGIVLTIGMAVDANVLVFERIREELRTGKTVRASIDAGYSRAFKTILDANITTLLTALVLYQFGTGPIRGFAVTLSIGVVVSMFTALVVTRVIFTHITTRRTLAKLSI